LKRLRTAKAEDLLPRRNRISQRVDYGGAG